MSLEAVPTNEPVQIHSYSQLYMPYDTYKYNKYIWMTILPVELKMVV